MRKGKVFWSILKRTNSDKIATGFIIYFLISAFFIMMTEPDIHRYGESIWYCFSVVTTIGFGDFAAVTVAGRILSIILGIYGVIVLALIPGIVASYYMEMVKIRANESIEVFLDKLERLDELSEEERRELSKKIKNLRLNRRRKHNF